MEWHKKLTTNKIWCHYTACKIFNVKLVLNETLKFGSEKVNDLFEWLSV